MWIMLGFGITGNIFSLRNQDVEVAMAPVHGDFTPLSIEILLLRADINLQLVVAVVMAVL